MNEGSRLLSLLRPHLLKVITACTLSMLGCAGLLAIPIIVRDILGKTIAGSQVSVPLQTWVILGTGLAVITFTIYAAYSMMSDVSRRVTSALRLRYIESILRLPVGFHRDHQSGKILEVLITSISDVEWFIRYTILTALAMTILVVGGTLMLFLVAWQLALVLLLTIPLVAFILKGIFGVVRRRMHESEVSMGAITGGVEEVLRGIEVVKANTAETHELERFREKQARADSLEQRSARWVGLIEPLILSSAIGVLLLVLLLGSNMMAAGELRPETLLSFVFYTLLVVPQSRVLTMLLLRWEHFRIGLRRLDEITSIPHESDDPGARPLPQPVGGRVEFRNVSFHYPDRDQALHEVSFRVQPGECIGLVGASGAGKTTLFSLLLRFDRPQTGSVFIDDTDLQFATASSLRSSIAIVPQDILLFDTTIAENVRYGKPEAPDEDVHVACRAARADQFIVSLPQGYETIVGERGVKLSGGQRQRIAIARAFLKDAPILLMDEGTASLDSKSEREIHEAMRMVIARRTTLIIAHRLATVVGLPRILVLDRGRIIDDGSHHDLLERCQIYRTLVETQFISMQREEHKVLR